LYRPYLFVLGASLVFWALVPSAAKDHPGQSDLEYILYNLILIPEVFPSRPVLTVTWTLSYIYAGYCFLPLLALAQRRWAPRLSQIMFWTMVVAAIFGIFLLTNRPMPRVAYIPAGCLLATWIANRSRLLLNRTQVAILLASTALLLTLRYQLHTNEFLLRELGRGRTVVFVSLGVLSMMLLTWVSISTEHKRQDWFQMAAPRALAVIGKRGYSIYLWHGPVSKILIGVCNILWPWVLLQVWGYTAMLVVCLVATLAVAEYSFRYIERAA
jgi:peptidoglycan/LPS O-acetylase OafA/YrhL